MAIDQASFKAVMGSFASGVTVVTTVGGDGKLWGITAAAVCSLSMNPPLLLVCVNQHSADVAKVKTHGKFAVNILGAAQQDLSNHFAKRNDDKFKDVMWRKGDASGCPLVEGALAWAECDVKDVHVSGDHEIWVGELTASGTNDGMPLTYYRGKYADLTPR